MQEMQELLVQLKLPQFFGKLCKMNVFLLSGFLPAGFNTEVYQEYDLYFHL